MVHRTLSRIRSTVQAHRRLAPGVAGRFYKGKIGQFFGRSFVAHVGRTIRPVKGIKTRRGR